jgi:GT2 family glycosyltransferase
MITVIIVNWNGKHLLDDCLGSLAQQTLAPREIILVDNGSTDGSLEWVAEHYPRVRLLPQDDNLGFAKANNLALEQVRTPYAALLNNDTKADPRWLEHLHAALQADPGAGSAACKMLLHDEPGVIDRAGDGYTRAGAAVMRGRGRPAPEYNKPERIFGACAGAALYRMAMLDQVGFLDEDFFLIHEDVDLAFRGQLWGWSCLYVPKAVVYHKVSCSLVHDSATSVYFGHRNLEWTYLKNMPAGLLLASLPLHLLYVLAAGVFFGLRGRGGDYLRAKRDALKGLPTVLRKRRQVQAGRRVSSRYLWGLMQSESFLPRLQRRRQQTGG